MLPDVLARLRAAGAKFVLLVQAQAHPAYARFGGGTLFIHARPAHEWSSGRGRSPRKMTHPTWGNCARRRRSVYEYESR